MPYTMTITQSRPSFGARVSQALSTLRSYVSGPLSLKDRELARKLGWADRASSAGVAVTHERAMGVSAFWSAITLIAGDVASLPLLVYTRSAAGGKQRALDHRLYALLHDTPNPDMSAMTFRETLMIWALATGNGYAEIERDKAGRVVHLWPLPSTHVAPFHDARGQLRYRCHGTTGDVIFVPADIVHLRGPSPDGVLGYDVVTKAREALGLSLAAETFGSTFFANGTAFGGVLKHPKTLTETTAKSLRESINAMHQGADKAHKIWVAEEGMDFQRFGVDPDAAQFLETRTFQLREIARYFKIPPSKIGELTNSNFSTVEQENLAYFTSCVRPWLIRIEQELSAKLLSRAERQTIAVEHVFEGLLRANTEARGAFYAQMLSHGVMTVNEVRALENLGPIENVLGAADIPRVPMNTMPLTAMSAATPATSLEPQP